MYFCVYLCILLRVLHWRRRQGGTEGRGKGDEERRKQEEKGNKRWSEQAGLKCMGLIKFCILYNTIC